VFITELALDVADPQVGGIDVALEMVGLHETGAAIRTKVGPARKQRLMFGQKTG
jgi:hypothetical protein